MKKANKEKLSVTALVAQNGIRVIKDSAGLVDVFGLGAANNLLRVNPALVVQAAMILRQEDPSLTFVCAFHGPYIASAGTLQLATCGGCMRDTAASHVKSEEADQ